MPNRNIDENKWTAETSVRIDRIKGTSTNIVVADAKYDGFEWITSVTPNYWALKSSGAFIPPRPLRWAKSHHESVHGGFTYKVPVSGNPSTWLERTGPYSTADFPLFDYLYPSSDEEASLSRQADSNLLSRLKNTKIDLAVAMAEGRETAGMIVSTARRIAKAGSRLRRGQFSAAARELGIIGRTGSRKVFERTFGKDQQKAFANGWLSLQYGWLPLLSDVYGAAEHLATRNTKRSRIRYNCGTNGADRPQVLNVGSVNRIGSRSFTSSYKSTLYYDITYDTLKEMSSLGFTNPLNVAWEVVPLSFVVDWFLPIGDYLANMDATIGCRYLGACRTNILDQQTITTVTGVGGSSGYTGSGIGSKVRHRIYMTTGGSWPANSFPRLTNPFSRTHAASAMSLLRQAFR